MGVTVPATVDGSKPFFIVVKFYVTESRFGEFESLTKEWISAAAREDNSLSYRFGRSTAPADGFIEVVLFEELKGQDALAAHSAGTCGRLIKDAVQNGLIGKTLAPEFYQELK